MKPWLWAFLLLCVWTESAFAQNNSPADTAQLVQALLTRVDQLEKRVAELEGEKTKPASPVTAPAAAETMQMGPLANPSVSQPSLNIAGFSDFSFSATDQKGVPSGFNEGQFILHLNSNLSSKVSFLGEISLTARSDAGTGSPAATGFNAEVE